MKHEPRGSKGRFAYEGLDRVIHERARLSVLTCLITNPKGLIFNDLKQLCSLTDGNLSRHLSVLETEHMVEITKGHEHNRPQTFCRITKAGRERFLEYLSTLEQVVADAAKVSKDEPAPRLMRSLTPSKAWTPFFGGNFTMQSNTFIPKNFAVPSDLHVAIIMDGNGRWAERRGLPRIAGHRAGAAAARRVVEHALDLGIRRLTLYAFSSDNWRRPALEVHSIFWLLRGYLRLERERLRKNGARLEVIGRRDRLPKALLQEIEEVEAATARGHRIHVRVAVDYSSRDAIAQAALGISSTSDDDRSSLTGLLGHLLAGNHDGTDDVDLLIRTGGEQRLSDFLLWESAYAELIFLDRMWPYFSVIDLEGALEVFRQRERRFGGIPTLSAQCPGLAAAGSS